ncbi:hypothetical protein RFI_19053, partial [Reticulomyxa filosa]
MNDQKRHCDISFPDVVVLFKNALDSNFPLSRLSDYLKLIKHLLDGKKVEENLSVFLTVFVLPILELKTYIRIYFVLLVLIYDKNFICKFYFVVQLWRTVMETTGEVLLTMWCKKSNKTENIKTILDKLHLRDPKSIGSLTEERFLEHVSLLLYPFTHSPQEFKLVFEHLQSDETHVSVRQAVISHWWHVLVSRKAKSECSECIKECVVQMASTYSSNNHEKESKSDEVTNAEKKMEDNISYGIKYAISAYWLTLANPITEIEILLDSRPLLCLQALTK